MADQNENRKQTEHRTEKRLNIEHRIMMSLRSGRYYPLFSKRTLNRYLRFFSAVLILVQTSSFSLKKWL
ncbi:hypothetical protein D1BOALGB6SA_2178 [Olavius sp. associated proteobacterium Delta 1]|nr:hypothetical protein D1BOALGB6SA_2178 [Olavius sp. associated proteobacterium Delta 1]